MLMQVFARVSEDDLKFNLALVTMIKYCFTKADSRSAKQMWFFVGNYFAHTFCMNIL